MMILLTLVLSVACVVDKSYVEGSLFSWSYKQIAYALFDAIDTDNDSRITIAEVYIRFGKYDANGDGEVTRYEYTEYKCKSSPELYDLSHYLFDECDMNGDNTVNRDDLVALFDKIDTTGNGKVGRREFIRYWQEILPMYKDVGPHEEKYMHGPSACH